MIFFVLSSIHSFITIHYSHSICEEIYFSEGYYRENLRSALHVYKDGILDYFKEPSLSASETPDKPRSSCNLVFNLSL